MKMSTGNSSWKRKIYYVDIVVLQHSHTAEPSKWFSTKALFLVVFLSSSCLCLCFKFHTIICSWKTKYIKWGIIIIKLLCIVTCNKTACLYRWTQIVAGAKSYYQLSRKCICLVHVSSNMILSSKFKIRPEFLFFCHNIKSYACYVSIRAGLNWVRGMHTHSCPHQNYRRSSGFFDARDL